MFHFLYLDLGTSNDEKKNQKKKPTATKFIKDPVTASQKKLKKCRLIIRNLSFKVSLDEIGLMLLLLWDDLIIYTVYTKVFIPDLALYGQSND